MKPSRLDSATAYWFAQAEALFPYSNIEERLRERSALLMREPLRYWSDSPRRMIRHLEVDPHREAIDTWRRVCASPVPVHEEDDALRAWCREHLSAPPELSVWFLPGVEPRHGLRYAAVFATVADAIYSKLAYAQVFDCMQDNLPGAD